MDEKGVTMRERRVRGKNLELGWGDDAVFLKLLRRNISCSRARRETNRL